MNFDKNPDIRHFKLNGTIPPSSCIGLSLHASCGVANEILITWSNRTLNTMTPSSGIGLPLHASNGFTNGILIIWSNRTSNVQDPLLMNITLQFLESLL